MSTMSYIWIRSDPNNFGIVALKVKGWPQKLQSLSSSAKAQILTRCPPEVWRPPAAEAYLSIREDTCLSLS